MASLKRFSWFVLAFNVAVIAWGGLVRATGSGAGCGRHWPTCDGVVVPRSPTAEMLIEYVHRATSGLAILLVLVLFVWARAAFAPGHRGRAAAAWALGLMVVEALLGAALVLFGWVAQDTSAARGWVMPIHLTNTFLLLGAIALVAFWAGRPAAATRAPLGASVVAALVAMVITGATGAIAALGDTLFPSTTFVQGVLADLDARSSLLLRLRTVHPFVAVIAAFACALVARQALAARGEPARRRGGLALAALVAVQLVAGVANLLLLAPIALQLVHLVLADLTWIALVVTAAASTEVSEGSGVRELKPALA